VEVSPVFHALFVPHFVHHVTLFNEPSCARYVVIGPSVPHFMHGISMLVLKRVQVGVGRRARSIGSP
jgi:hypothetical protein